jgi:hypothetical protein
MIEADILAILLGTFTLIVLFHIRSTLINSREVLNLDVSYHDRYIVGGSDDN